MSFDTYNFLKSFAAELQSFGSEEDLFNLSNSIDEAIDILEHIKQFREEIKNANDADKIKEVLVCVGMEFGHLDFHIHETPFLDMNAKGFET